MPFSVRWSRLAYRLWHKLRHPRLREAIAEQCRADWLNPAELKQLQLARLKPLLSHAWRNCPFYRRKFEQAGLTEGRIDAISSTDELSEIPVLIRREIQDNRDDMIGRNFSHKQLLRDRTGGSSGKPLHFYRDTVNFPHMAARRYRGDMMVGWDFGKRSVMLWGARLDTGLSEKIFRRFFRIMVNEVMMDCSRVDDVDFDDCLRRLEAYHPHMIVAYSSIAGLFAEKALELGYTDIRPECVLLTAENETPAQRALIERAFGCRVFNRYGSREMSVIACECDRHRGRHVLADQMILEVVDDAGRPLPPGKKGWIVITDLFNYGMPFIRYRIGDIGALSDEPCNCGRGLPMLTELIGGASDAIHLPSGWRVGRVIISELNAALPSALNYQLVHKSDTEFTLRVLKGPDFDETELPGAVKVLKKVLGPGVTVSTEYATDIIRGPGGKYDFLITCPPQEQS